MGMAFYKGSGGDDLDAPVGVHGGQVGVAGNNQYGLGGCGQRQELVVVGVAIVMHLPCCGLQLATLNQFVKKLQTHFQGTAFVQRRAANYALQFFPGFLTEHTLVPKKSNIGGLRRISTGFPVSTPISVLVSTTARSGLILPERMHQGVVVFVAQCQVVWQG